MYAELLEDSHRPPVIEGWLLQPGLSIKVGRDAGTQLAFERVPKAGKIPLAATPVDKVAEFALPGDTAAQFVRQSRSRVEPVEHLVRNLRIARFIGSHQAKAVATHQGGLSIEKEKKNKSEKDGGLT
jgi:hypothetical protein